MAGDVGLARNRMRKHLLAETEFFRRRRSTRQLLPDSVVLDHPGPGKGAETVARHVTQTIMSGGLQPGDLVGTEHELIEHEGVSRALLREAVRLLEHHHIARMRRGPGGGLFVMAPSADAVTGVAAIYLARRRMQLSELAELGTGVEVAIADLAAARIDEVGVLGLRDAIAHEEHATDADRAEAVYDLHAAVAAAAQNRVLQLVALVLIRLGRLHQVERLNPRAQKQVSAEVLHRTRASPVPSRTVTGSWPGTACAGTSRRSAPSFADPEPTAWTGVVAEVQEKLFAPPRCGSPGILRVFLGSPRLLHMFGGQSVP